MSAQTVLLNRKLEKMRAQYRDNVVSMESMRSDYEKSLSERLSAMQQEMKEKLSEHDEQLRTELENELEKYSADLSAELNRRIDEINSEYARLKAENDEMRAQMKKTEKELSDELAGMSGRLSSREENMKREAQCRMEKVYDEFQKFSDRYPHESFEPNAADALLMQMESVKVDFSSGFYEACMASSSGIGFQIAMIEDRVRKSMEQWVRYFDQLESYTGLVNEFIASDDFTVIKNERFEKALLQESSREADTFDFWSDGQYSAALEDVHRHAEFTAQIRNSGGKTREEKITSFLKNQKKNGTVITFEELAARIDEVTELHKKICTMRVNIHTGFTASFERAADLSKKIISLIEGDRCGEIISKGFRDSDIRKEYVIEASEPGRKITVEIFPVCPDRMTVVNSIGIYFEHNGSGTVENLKKTEENFLNALKRISGDAAVISESNCSADFSAPEKAMENIKNRANEKRRKELSLRRRVR